ncbi:MAG: rRNA pseudouridine synthase [Aestuariivirga sp.]|uniref:pseudouridine synthase n=1 Tax=Aestuariivirga sp. TaxID=2650926 RepID=UPI0025C5488F|nr:pseudouridine synthase [Aestuariivirga sp.]MCA3559875.1 rRNA pseudouridine synthase [Aestuariivirga sp.]
MRLNVYLQKAGAGSRREAERLVAGGRVSVNGSKATPTTPVEEGDTVLIDGRPVAPETKLLPRLFLLNKPVDVLVTHRDHKGRKTIFDLPALNPPQWTGRHPRVMNVGRLDVNSEGLLVLSSDGPLAQAMMSPEMALSRLYRVRVRGQLNPAEIEAIAQGIAIDGVEYRGAEFVEEYGQGERANRWYRCVLTEGKNREIRKLFDHFGCVVNRLVRLQYGPFTLGGMEPGEVREAPAAQVKALMDELAKKGAKL